MKLIIKTSLVVIILDLLSKWLSWNFLDEPVDLWILDLEQHRNEVLAWGIPVGGIWPMVLAIAALVIILGIIWRSRNNLDRAEKWGWGMIVGGGIANLAERFISGAVTDFIDFGWFPAFNVADIAITAGVVLLLWWWIFRGHEK